MINKCACGCGNGTNPGRTYIKGHQCIGRKSSDETKKRQSIALTGNTHTEETKKKISDGLKGRVLSEEHKKKISDKLQGRIISIESRHKISETMRGVPKSLDTRKRMSIAQRNRPAEFNNAISERMMGANNPAYGKIKIVSDETKKKMSVAKIGKKVSDESKRRMSKAQTGEKSHQWKGGVSFHPYCEKFNRAFKENIREKYNRVCFLCGKSEAEQMDKQKNEGKKVFRLSVHHTNYKKECLCSENECEFVPLCDSCHGKTNHERNKWELIIINKLKLINNK